MALLKQNRKDWSELKPKSELDRAGAADLVERTETAIRAAGAETARQRLRGAAK